MKKKYNKLTCLFGHHDYSRKPSIDKDEVRIFLCKVCKRSAYRNLGFGTGVRFDYDKEGNRIYMKFTNGEELWLGVDGYWSSSKLRSL